MRLGFGALDKTGHTFQVVAGNQRAEFGVGIVLQAVTNAAHGRPELLHEGFVHALLHVQAARGGAVLARVIEAKGAYAFNGGIDVGIVKNQYGGLAAQFHMGAFNAAGGGTDNACAGLYGTRERDQAYFRVSYQGFAHAWATAKQDVYHASREDLGNELSQFQCC